MSDKLQFVVRMRQAEACRTSKTEPIFSSLFSRKMKNLIIAIFLLLFVSGAQAQQSPGSIRGQVADEFGGLIVGATVTATGADGAQKTAITDAEGNYALNGLAPGRYIVRATAQGFALFENAEVDVTAGQREQLKITLSVSLEKEEVAVASEAGVSTEPENNAGALVLRGTDLDSLPDDPDELAAALQALAGPSAGPNGGQFFIDGFTGGRLPPKESIREIRINQNPFSAEYDRLGFGRVEILTKPGTDKFRGQVFGTFNDESLNSRNAYASNRAPSQVRQYGGSVSGPIIAKKASFFFDFERRETDDNAVINARILDTSDPLLPEVPFSLAVVQPGRRLTFSPRFDYQLNTANTLVARYTYTRNRLEDAGLGSFNLPERAFDTFNTEHTFQLTETAVLSPTVINETRFQYISGRREQEGNNTVPTVLVSEAFNGGGSQVGLYFNNEDRWELQNNTSWIMSRHSFRAGVRLRGVRTTEFTQSNFGGTFVFSGRTGPGAPSSLDVYRQTLLNTPGFFPSQFSIAVGNPEAKVSQVDFGGFIQDDWRVRPNLTLSMGLRYEAQTNLGSKYNFAPRVGFAWSPGGGGARQPKMVIRGGFGIFYDRFNESLTLQTIRFNGVNQQSFLLTSPARLDQVVFNLDGTVSNVPTPAELAALGQPQTLRLKDDDLESPYTMQGVISVERQLPYRFTLATTFVSSRTLHMFRSRNINAPLPGTFVPLVQCSGIRPFNTCNNFYEYESTGTLNQNQLIINVNNRLNPNFSLFASYILGKASGDTDGAGTFPADTYDMSREYGRSSFDVRHRFVIGGSFGAPWKLRLNPFVIANSGRPFNITTGADLNGDRQFTERPSLAAPGAVCSNTIVCTRFGNFNLNPGPNEEIIARNYGHGPSFFAVNLRVSRTFGFGTVGQKNAAEQPGGAGGQRGGQRGGRGSSGGSSGGRGGSSGGRSGGTSGAPLGAGALFGGAGQSNSAAEKRFNLTFSVNFQNLLNHTNKFTPIGNLTSPSFGESNASAGSFGGGGATGNRRIEAQVRLTF